MGDMYSFTKAINTSQSQDRVFQEVITALGPLGGTLTKDDGARTIRIVDGKVGITGSFMFTTNADLRVRKASESQYLVDCQVTKEMDPIFWAVLIIGLFFWPLWILLIFYFIADLGKEYQNALGKADMVLGGAPPSTFTPPPQPREGDGTRPPSIVRPPPSPNEDVGKERCPHCGKVLDFDRLPKHCPFCDGEIGGING